MVAAANSMDQEHRLDRLERHADKTEGRIEVIEKTQSTHTVKLDQIVQAVTVQGAIPRLNVHEWIRSGAAVVSAGAVIAALLIWTIVRTTEANDRVLETRLNYAEKSVDFVLNAIDLKPNVSEHLKTGKTDGP